MIDRNAPRPTPKPATGRRAGGIYSTPVRGKKGEDVTPPGTSPNADQIRETGHQGS
jgi:hypothetical protein